jgi:DNA-directed RNA polymerase specialized sigma24 family protein
MLAPPEATPAFRLAEPAFMLDPRVLKQLSPFLFRQGLMSTKGAPAKPPVTAPDADETPSNRGATPAQYDAAHAAKLTTSPEKEEIGGTLSSGARFTGQEEPEAKMNPSPSYATHVERVVSVEVQTAIRARLRNRGVWAQDIEDVAQDVTAELLFMKDPPADLDGCIRLARRAVNDESIDLSRKGSRRGEYNLGPTPHADLHTGADHASPEICHPIDRQRQIALLSEKVAEGVLTERDAQLLLLDGQGANAVEIGRELKLAPQTVRNSLSRAKNVVRSAWASRLKGPLALFGLLLMAWWLKKEHDEHAERERQLYEIHPDVPFAPPPPTPEQRAAQLRDEARDACANGRWLTCRADLDDASKLDPAGEARPEVQRMRKAIADGTVPMPMQPSYDKP